MSAVGLEIITRIIGYALEPGNFAALSPNLPIRVGILSPANDDMQSDLDPETPIQITSSAGAAIAAGYGSPLHQICKILFPISGGGLGGIPTFWYPQAKAVGATTKTAHVAGVGTATGNGTHYVVISGRKNVEGKYYAVNIIKGDTAAIIHGKISDAVNNVLGSPMSGSDTDYYAELESKWSDLTANGILVKMDTNGNDLGMTYSVSYPQAGSGTPDIQDSLALFANNWVTHVVNAYGTVDAVMTTLEDFNGAPMVGSNPPTGRYAPTVFKPFLAYTGSVLADPSSITDSRKNKLTIKISPAPLSEGLPMEAAANDCLLSALISQNSPHLDTAGMSYPDMPTPEAIGVMSDVYERQRIILKGCATVDLVGGVYQIQDPVTTYHPVDEVVPQYRFVRNIVIDWNSRYTYLLKEQLYVRDHAIAKDDETVNATKVIKPKIWKSICAEMASEMVLRGLWVDAPFMVASLVTGLSTTNPDKLATSYRYKRSGYVRVSDTVATGGFEYGTLTANQ